MRLNQKKAILELLGTELDSLMMSVHLDLDHFIDLVDSFEYYLGTVDKEDWPLGSYELVEYRNFIIHTLLVDYMHDSDYLNVDTEKEETN